MEHLTIYLTFDLYDDDIEEIANRFPKLIKSFGNTSHTMKYILKLAEQGGQCHLKNIHLIILPGLPVEDQVNALMRCTLLEVLAIDIYYQYEWNVIDQFFVVQGGKFENLK